MSLAFKTVTIAATGVAQSLNPSSSLVVSSALIQAIGGDNANSGANTGKVHIGPATVTDSGTTGVQLAVPVDGVTPPSLRISSGGDSNLFDLSSVYVCGVEGDGVVVLYHTV